MGSTVTLRLANSTAQSFNRIARRYDFCLVVVWLLMIPAIAPLFQPTLTRSADGLLHLYRVVALEHALRQGVLFPRWWPDLVYGYGLPLFVFYAPFSYYLTASLDLPGLGPVGALNASFAGAVLVAGTGSYLMVKDWFGSRAGVLAGMAYVYAPYPLYNVFFRGSLPIAWATALLPWAFWAFGRLVREGRPRYLLPGAGLSAAALLSHNISALLFLPLLIFYLVVLLLAGHHGPAGTGRPFSRLLGAGLALALGLGLSAFFLAPAVLETGFIQVQRVVTPPDFDYHSNFVGLAELMALPQPANTGLLNPDLPLSLGPVQVILALLGLLSLHRLAAFQRPAVVFATAGLAGAVFFTLPVSVKVWDSLPFLAFVQQPHRLLSLAAFLLALLAGAAVARPGRLSDGLIWLGIVLIFLTAVPLLYPRYYSPLPAEPSLAGMMAYERASGAIGTTSFGEYLPVWVRQIPHESPLEPMYRAGGTAVERLDRAYLPPGTAVESAAYGFNRAELLITSPEPYQAVFHTFYFPGWEAFVDGQPATIAPFSERGLVSIAVPAGQHRLLLRFGETPVRLAANILSGLALLAVVVLGIGRLRFGLAAASPAPRPVALDPARFAGLGVMVALGLIAVKLLYFDPYDSPFKHVFDGSRVAGAAVTKQVNFGQQVNLLGYNLREQTVESGRAFELTLCWQARQQLATDYSALAQLVDREGHLYAGQDNLHPGRLPATWWEPWGFVQDRHRVPVPAGTPPGDYFLAAGLYDPGTWARLPVLGGGNPGWSDVLAIPVRVTKPGRPPALTELGIQWPVTGRLAPALQLLGASPERAQIQRNDFLRVALFWEALAAPVPDYQVSLRLVAGDGTAPLAETGRPSYGRYPTPLWTAGERVRDNHALWIPADLPGGTYRLQVQVIDPTGQPTQAWLDLGELMVEEE